VTGDVLSALQDESAAFSAALSDLAPPLWRNPTRCEPWLVRDVVGHVINVLARVPAMVAAPAPDRADTTAITYYRADQRFSEAANGERVRSARVRAAVDGVAALADVTRQVVAACEGQPADRVVRTRHGDAMLLDEFLLTRLFETAVHGIDVADAVSQAPWLTPAAAGQLPRMLSGALLGEATVGDLRRASGRAPDFRGPHALTLN
jgi:uncharacterized protein (TIGR03083 family)